MTTQNPIIYEQDNDRVILISSQAEYPTWDDYVASSPHGHLMQSSRWGALKTRFGWEVERLILMEKNTIVAGAQILYRSLPLKLGKLAYVPMGPVVNWENEDHVRALLVSLQRTARRRGAFCLKLEPAAINSPDPLAILASQSFQPSPCTVQWRSNILIDLDCTEDEILTRFSKKHRQKLHKAAREGIIIQSANIEDLPAIRTLLDDTAERKAFAVYPQEYYQTCFTLFASERLANLLLATYQDRLLAWIMVFVLGKKAYCLYAASGSEHRDLMPTYLLHWEGIRWAHAQGCLVYDYCGIPDEVGQDPDNYAHEERHDGLWGVYRFKRGFGGQVVSYIGTHDQIYHRLLYNLYNNVIGILRNKMGETWNRKLFSG